MKKVAIVGFAPTRDRAPYKDKNVEIWSVNNLYKFIPRTDRIFQMHHPRHLIGEHHGVKGTEHVEFLQNTEIPVYMQEKYPDIPASVKLPLEELTKEFGIERPDGSGIDAYWTNSISFMIALAIHEGFDEIQVWGVDMAVATEYNEQRPSCEYYLGIAKGRGIKILIPPESDLLKTRFVYGYDEDAKSAWELKVDKTVTDMSKRMMQSNQAVADMQLESAKCMGAIIALSSLRQTEKTKKSIAGLKQQKAEIDAGIRGQQSVSDKYEGAISAVEEMKRTWQ